MPGPSKTKTDPVRDTHVDWTVFKLILLVCPALFVGVAVAMDAWSTALPLGVFAALVAVLILFRRRGRRAVTLHVAIGLLITYQTILLHATVDEPNIGIVWFLAVPAVVALLGNRSHILIWTPITIAVISYCWTLYSSTSLMAHSLALPNLIGATLVVSFAAFGVITQRDRREKALTEALEAARIHAIERELAEREASEGRAAVTTFLGSMSHELRTPLTSIVLSADVLDEALDDPEQTDWVQNIRQSAQSLVLLLNDVLDLARGDAGQAALSDEPFAIEDLLGGVVAIVRPMAVAHQVDLFVGAMPNVARRWQGDEARIRQVLVNLVNNALQHAGGSQVGLQVTQQDNRLTFSVSDNGRGIDESLQREIFQPFHQLPSALGENEKSGTGLGLAICKGYVAAMGGELRVSSQPGAGAIFSFSLAAKGVQSYPLSHYYPARAHWPSAVSLTGANKDALLWARHWLTHWGIALNASGDSLQLIAPASPPTRSIEALAACLDGLGGSGKNESALRSDPNESTSMVAKGRHCLICDDDPQILKVVSAILESSGHRTICVDSTAGMLRYLKDNPVDIIFLDVNLGSESGIDALSELRALPGTAARTPVCMLSGALDHQEAALAAGANDYLLKPSSAEELNATIGRLLAQSGTQIRFGKVS